MGNYTAAPEGDVSSLIPLDQVYGVHAFFNEPRNEVQIQLPSEYTQFAWQNYSRFQVGSIVARWGEPSELGYALEPSIDGISVDFADGSTLTADEFIDQKPVDGFIVIRDGKIVYERYETMRPFDKHIWFSSSKVVGATRLALLEAEGQIDLSRPVSDFITELKGSVWDTVSVQETVDMTTGLNGTEHDEPNHDSRTNPEQIWFQWSVAIGVFKGEGERPSPWDVLRTMERRQEGHRAFEYNSINTFVIDNIVERVSGETIMELFGEKVWRRIGAEGDAFIGVSLDGNPLTFGLINTNLRDFARFGMIFTPMAAAVFGEEIVPAAVVEHIQASGRPEMFDKGYVGEKMFSSFFEDKDTGLGNAYMWDTIFPDGDLYKAGVGGQGVYISPATNTVVAYFMTGTGNDGPETVARDRLPPGRSLSEFRRNCSMDFRQASLALGLALGLAGNALAADFDLAILNGRVMDPETMFDDIANVGITDGRIAAISKQPLVGSETIDATGHIVAPGFIDTHFHWQQPMGYALGLRDGLTSSMDIEEGCAGTIIAEWYAVRDGQTQANYGCASSHEQARAIALDGFDDHDTLMHGPAAGLETRKADGWSLTRADFDTGNEILRIIDEGLQAGAIGIGSTLGYMRDGVTSREMFEVQKVGSRYGRHTAVHTRFTPDTATFENLGAQEIIANAIALDAPATINHYNNPGWRLAHEIISRLQEQGFNIWGEIYPYAAGSTALNAVFLSPDNWVEKLGHRYEDTLQDPVTGEYYTLESYKKELAEDPTKEILLYKMPEEDAAKWLTLRGTTMASDAMFAAPLFADWNTPFKELGNTHPRTAGARAATLRIGRENDIPLMQLISILSYNAAHHLGRTGLKAMQERGRIQEGMVADIVVFDPETVTDNATYEKGAAPSTGFKAVIVNGEVTVRDDELLEVFAGQPIRFEPEDKPRFEPVTEEAWNRDFSTGMPDVSPGIPPKGGN